MLPEANLLEHLPMATRPTSTTAAPPSTIKTALVKDDKSSLVKQKQVLAISVGRATRRNGTSDETSVEMLTLSMLRIPANRPITPSIMGVRTPPRQMMLHRTVFEP
jgi:hypothetical protein